MTLGPICIISYCINDYVSLYFYFSILRAYYAHQFVIIDMIFFSNNFRLFAHPFINPYLLSLLFLLLSILPSFPLYSFPRPTLSPSIIVIYSFTFLYIWSNYFPIATTFENSIQGQFQYRNSIVYPVEVMFE